MQSIPFTKRNRLISSRHKRSLEYLLKKLENVNEFTIDLLKLNQTQLRAVKG